MQREVLISVVSLIPAIIWIGFYVSFRKSERAVTVRSLAWSFLAGSALSSIVVGIEFAFSKGMAAVFGSLLNVFSVSPNQVLNNLPSLIMIAIISSMAMGLLETFVQNYFLKVNIKKRQDVGKVLQGVQLALFFGLGFAVPKNVSYVFYASSLQQLDGLVIFQVFISGLAYTTAAGLLGYFISLSKFHRLYEEQFLQRGFQVMALILILLQFNFFLLRQVFSFTIWILLIVFGLLMKYLMERRDFEIALILRQHILPPSFYEKREIITFLVNEKLSYYEMKRLAFCPNCFIIKKPEWRVCPYCETKF